MLYTTTVPTQFQHKLSARSEDIKYNHSVFGVPAVHFVVTERCRDTNAEKLTQKPITSTVLLCFSIAFRLIHRNSVFTVSGYCAISFNQKINENAVKNRFIGIADLNFKLQTKYINIFNIRKQQRLESAKLKSHACSSKVFELEIFWKCFAASDRTIGTIGFA